MGGSAACVHLVFPCYPVYLFCSLPQIKADFASSGVTDTQLGLISSTFTLVFGLARDFCDRC